MATRGKRTIKRATARKTRRPASRKPAGRRTSAAASKKMQAERAASRRRAEAATNGRIVAASSGWANLRVVWRPAIAMATLPYRVYRVYRWAEAESLRRSAGGPAATA